jgi:hypothetical protein
MFSVMKSRILRALCLAAAAIGAGVVPAQAQPGTSFTYQGNLMDGGVPANGFYDIFLTPYAAATGSQTLSRSFCADNVQVVNGLFAVQVPLGMPPSGPLFLGIEVRRDDGTDCGSDVGLVELSPRQEVTPAPHALYATAIRQEPAPVLGALRLTAQKDLDVFDGSVWRRVTNISTLPAVFNGTAAFDTAGLSTFVVPEGVTEIFVAAWGGQGGGGALGPGTTSIGTGCSSNTNFACAGGGGAPGAAISARIAVTPGESLNVVVGAGGNTLAMLPGANGGTTAIRRGGVDVLLAPGGGGGGRATAGVGMQVVADFNSCGDPPAGVNAALAGTAPAAPQLLGAGTVISSSVSLGGATRGRGPSCWFALPLTGTCPAVAGEGGVASNLPLGPEFNDAPAPTGPAGAGAGASPTSPASVGVPGRVRIYWL